MAAWVALDASFDGLGQGLALFGLSGRLAACPAALMLVGATILMAWQTRGVWRSRWQYAALAAGVLLTSSLGWAQRDAAAVASAADPAWFSPARNLLLSASMMTLMSGLGLAACCPAAASWTVRGRRAMRFFGGLSLLLLLILLIQLALR